jgi:hypothetical protein
VVGATVKLTEVEWDEVFRLCCKSKRGDKFDKSEQALVLRVFREDAGRYGDMEEV